MKLAETIIDHSYKANNDFLIGQNNEYKNLCLIADKIEELLDLLAEQTFSGEKEDSIVKAQIKFEDQLEVFEAKVFKALTNKLKQTKKKLLFTRMGLASIATKEIKKSKSIY